MEALLFENRLAKIATTKILSYLSSSAFVGPLAPLQLREMNVPALPADDWVLIRTKLAALCGSDYKQVFLNGSIDNPMTALISFPHVLGHEMMGVIEKIGPKVKNLRIGQRVALNPWLSCAPRGLKKCAWCEQGQFSLCVSFTKGSLKSGCHSGNCAGASGGFATFTPAHESMAIPIPDDIRDEQAVLSDPWSVSFHGIIRNPPPEGGTALVYGCGTLGLMAIAILKHFFPSVKILAVARFDHQEELAKKLGANRVFRSSKKEKRRVIDEIAKELKIEILEPWFGMPMVNGGVSAVYDTISSPETLEVGLRVTDSRGKIVIYGVEPAKRFEWTPLYFKEISVIGSNAYGVESFRGQSKYAFEWFFEALKNGMPDVTSIISHEFPLRDYKKAFLSCRDQGLTRAVKVVFRF